MSNVAQKKTKRDLRLIVIEAVVLTVIVHASFFLLFDYKRAQPRKLEPKPYKTMMLNLRTPQRLSMRAVGEWLEYQNPAVMSRPDYRFGYSVAGALPGWHEQRALPQIAPPTLVANFTVSAFENLNANRFPSPVSSRAELSGLSPAEPNSLHIAQVATPPLKYPLALIKGVPLNVIDLSAAKLPEDFKNITASRLSIALGESDMMPRVVLKASCGDSALDQAAIRATFDYVLKNPQEPLNDREMTILWHSGGAK